MKSKAVIFYITDEMHKKLKAKLSLKGSNMSKWLREKIQEYLTNEKN